MKANMKTFKLEYTLDDATLEQRLVQADDELDAEDQLEEMLGTDDYDLVSIEETAL
jgi:hypothetical protein